MSTVQTQQSADNRARINHFGCGFEVFPNQTPDLIVTTQTNITKTPVTTVIPGYNTSIFEVRKYEGDGCWHVDINCGFQRWDGWKSTRQIKAALRKLGFAESVIAWALTRARRARRAV